MTIQEAINGIDDIKPNTYTNADKIAWLSELDGMVKLEIIDTHYYNEGEEEVTFTPYTDEDMTKELLVPHPYSDIYLKWLEAKIDYANNETARYINSSSVFNGLYTNYNNYYNRTHKPKTTVFRYFR